MTQTQTQTLDDLGALIYTLENENERLRARIAELEAELEQQKQERQRNIAWNEMNRKARLGP